MDFSFFPPPPSFKIHHKTTDKLANSDKQPICVLHPNSLSMDNHCYIFFCVSRSRVVFPCKSFAALVTFWHLALHQRLRIVACGFVLMNEDLDSSAVIAVVSIFHNDEGHCLDSLVMSIPGLQCLAACFAGGLVSACEVSIGQKGDSP